jgi:hypothetical protein
VAGARIVSLSDALKLADSVLQCAQSNELITVPSGLIEVVLNELALQLLHSGGEVILQLEIRK